MQMQKMKKEREKKETMGGECFFSFLFGDEGWDGMGRDGMGWRMTKRQKEKEKEKRGEEARRVEWREVDRREEKRTRKRKRDRKKSDPRGEGGGGHFTVRSLLFLAVLALDMYSLATRCFLGPCLLP